MRTSPNVREYAGVSKIKDFRTRISNLDSTHGARATRNVLSTDRRDTGTMSAAEGAPSEVYSTAEREGGEGAGNAAGGTTESQGAAAAGGGGASCRSTSPRAAPGCGGPESPPDPSASPENSNNSNGRYVTFCDVLKNIRYVTSHPCNVSFVTCNDGVPCNVKSPAFPSCQDSYQNARHARTRQPT